MDQGLGWPANEAIPSPSREHPIDLVGFEGVTVSATSVAPPKNLGKLGGRIGEVRMARVGGRLDQLVGVRAPAVLGRAGPAPAGADRTRRPAVTGSTASSAITCCQSSP